MITTKGFHDIGSEFITCDTYTLIAYDTSKGDHCNTGSTTTDIDDHITYRFFHIYTDTECSSHWFMKEIYFFRACLLCTIAHRSLFHFRNGRWNTDHHSPARGK